ncbi:MAG: response regulator [Prolixibacteraceae bacterium]
MTEKSQLPRILIVDDVAINIDLMKSILQEDNYLIAAAKDGRTALAKTMANVFDLILLDIVLPDIDGFEVCRQIKASSRNQDTPVIFLTAQRDEESLVKGFRLGAVDYVLKPFSAEELRARVELHISLKKTREELKKARDIAEEAAKAKALFLANMSHEIRTPLNGIVGMVDILLQTNLDELQREYLGIIDISSETLLMIINDILDFSKIDAGQISFEQISFNVRSEIEEVYKLLAYSAKQKNLEFSVHVDDDVPGTLIGDPFRLKQILINLSNNAIKFTKKGHVRIKVSQKQIVGQKDLLHFQVEDSGIGISPENQQKLFKSFSQADTSTTRNFGGTGLGLAISKRLVQMMDGDIGVISSEGEGSVFWFTILLHVASTEIMAKEEFKGDTDHKPLKILLVEDNVINQKVSMLNIRKLGHQVQLAVNGIEAVKVFSDGNSFDIILMDVHMPGMDGLQATREIRRIEEERGVKHPVPVIAMTATIYEEDIREYKNWGIDDYLGKPFKPADLAQVISKNMGRYADHVAS